MFTTLQIKFDLIATQYEKLFTGAEFVKIANSDKRIFKYHYLNCIGQCALTFFQMPTGSVVAEIKVRKDFTSPCNTCNYVLQAPLGSNDPILHNDFWTMSIPVAEANEMFNILERFSKLGK